MVATKDFLVSYRFDVMIDGKRVALASVSEIDVEFLTSGRTVTKPIEIVAAPQTGTKGLAGVFGERPWQRRDVTLNERDRDDSPGRMIQLLGCKVKGYKVDKHDAMDESVVIDRVKLHPKRVRFIATGGKG